MLGFDLSDTVAGKQLMDIGFEKGIEQGKLQDAREMLIEVLEERFDVLPVQLIDEIKRIPRRETLKELLADSFADGQLDQFPALVFQGTDL